MKLDWSDIINLKTCERFSRWGDSVQCPLLLPTLIHPSSGQSAPRSRPWRAEWGRGTQPGELAGWVVRLSFWRGSHPSLDHQTQRPHLGHTGRAEAERWGVRLHSAGGAGLKCVGAGLLALNPQDPAWCTIELPPWLWSSRVQVSQ